MGRSPCCSKEGLNRGAWTALEDKILTAYIKAHGEGKWRNLPKRAGLKRCGKSCRLRWLNYLRPDIKRGNISHDEEELIIRLHNLLGNRWSLIAGRLPGRTDNEIKNYWNTTLGKKAKAQSSSPTSSETPPSKSIHKTPSAKAEETKIQVIRTKATRCSGNVLVPSQPPPVEDTEINLVEDYQPDLRNHDDQEMASTEVFDEMPGSDFLNFEIDDQLAQLQTSNGESEENNDDISKNLALDPMQPLEFDEEMFKDWTTNSCLDDNAAMNLDSLAFLLDPDQWP